jgi:hypothetical protein
MYASQGINVYDALDPAEPRVRCAVFKWLRAGWSGINMVKRKHIFKGLIRFADTFSEIVESPLMPSVEKLSSDYAQIKALSTGALRARMQVYSNVLKERYRSPGQRSNKWPADIFANTAYWSTMTREEMQSALVVEYLKHALGKTRPHEVHELLGFTR